MFNLIKLNLPQRSIFVAFNQSTTLFLRIMSCFLYRFKPRKKIKRRLTFWKIILFYFTMEQKENIFATKLLKILSLIEKKKNYIYPSLHPGNVKHLRKISAFRSKRVTHTYSRALNISRNTNRLAPKYRYRAREATKKGLLFIYFSPKIVENFFFVKIRFRLF